MIDFTKKGQCVKCKFWTPFPENNMGGRCDALGVLNYTNNEVAITISTNPFVPNLNLVSDVAAVRTRYDFGCNSYYPK